MFFKKIIFSVRSENMNDELHIPQIANDRNPEIGMKFASR